MKHATPLVSLCKLVGRLNDPRSTGLGLNLLTWIALTSDSYAEALEYSEQTLAAAVTPLDRNGAINGKGCALVLLRRTEEGAAILKEARHRWVTDGVLYNFVASDVAISLSKVFQGHIGEGIHSLEKAITKLEFEGYRVGADEVRLYLAEVYLQIIAGNEKLPLLTLLKNLPILLKVMVTAPSRIRALVNRVQANPQFDKAGHQIGRSQMTLGLLYKIKKRRALALEHLTEARRILSQFGQTPILARVDAALAELGQ